MPFALTTPVINGNHFSYASVEFDVAGLVFADVVAIDYADPVKPGKIYGTGGVLIGRTPGTSKPTLSITVTRRVWDALRAQLSDGKETYGLTSFIVRVTYFEPKLLGADAIPEQLISDIIEEVRVVGPSTKNAPGNAATTVVLECDPVKIKWGKNEIREGSTALNDDEEGSTVVENDPVQGSNVASQEASSTWWASDDDGFWAAGNGINAPNTWDTMIIGGIKLPGLCKVACSRPPSRAIEEQKPNGSDAAAMIDRGYLQATIDVDVTLWMRGHLAAWEGVIRELWSTPGKASRFEAPLPQVVKTGPATPDQQKKQVARANAPIFREIKAITAGRTANAQRAIEIYHPALALLGISKAVIESPGVLVAGAESQTMTTKMKLRQYLPADAGVRNATARVKGSAPAPVGVTVSLQGKPPVNDPSVPPGAAETMP